MRIEWTAHARMDLEQAYDFIDQFNTTAARRFFIQIFRAVEQLVEFPELGRVVEDVEPAGRCRYLVVGHYRVIYAAVHGVVFIVRVWDSRQNPDALKVESDSE